MPKKLGGSPRVSQERNSDPRAHHQRLAVATAGAYTRKEHTMKEVLTAIAEAWEHEAKELEEHVAEGFATHLSNMLEAEVLRRCASIIKDLL